MNSFKTELYKVSFHTTAYHSRSVLIENIAQAEPPVAFASLTGLVQFIEERIPYQLDRKEAKRILSRGVDFFLAQSI